MTAAELALALLRTTLATAIAACLAMLLLASLKVATPRVHRIAWALVVLQGWLLVPWTFQIESPPELAYRKWDAMLQYDILPPTPSQSLGDNTPSTSEFDWYLAPTTSRVPWFLVALWITSVLLAAVTATWRYAKIVRLLPLGVAPIDVAWQAEWRDQLAASHIRQKIDLRITDRLGPLLAYIPFTHLILAPRPLWTALTSAERTAILRHELAHLRRRDLWKSLALRALALPQWFNPLVWLALRRFDEAAEWACDDAATAAHPNDNLTLANSLLHAAEFATTTPCGAVAVQGGVLSRRIQRLVTPRFKEESTMRKLAVPSLLAALAAAQLIRIERVAAESTVDQASHAEAPPAPTTATRREYKESAWPRYIVEPPDILAIDAIKLVPKAPHRLEAFDAMIIRVAGAFPEQPIDDTYSVDADGTINLGPTYGRIRVAGLTIEEAEEHIRADLSKVLTDVKASASLVASAGAQQITGQHLVAMDGRVNLGVYGSVYVAGLTIEETCEAIEKKLAEKLEKPQVSVDVLSYNSKVYYVITKGGGKGDNVVRAPITGNDTVLDAIANLGGMSVNAATKIWIARPAPNGVGKETILPVNWSEIAQGAEPATNYQLMPGDRLFIEPQRPAEAQQPQEATTRVAPPAEPVVESPAGNLGAYVAEAAPTSDEFPVAARPTPTYAGPSRVQPNPAAAQPPQPVQELADRTSVKQVLFKISVIRDRSGDVAELGASLREDGAATGDTESILGALRILRKHKLIDTLADPTIVTVVGRPASIELHTEIFQSSPYDRGDHHYAVTVNPKSIGGDAEGSLLRLEVNLAHDEAVDRGFDLHFGETVIFASSPHDKLGPGQTYVVITPERVK